MQVWRAGLVRAREVSSRNVEAHVSKGMFGGALQQGDQKALLRRARCRTPSC